MWDCHWWPCSPPTKPPNQTSLLTPPQNDAEQFSSAAAARSLTSWLNRRRLRYLLLILCSPFLIPLFFVTFPFICAVEIFLFIGRRRRRLTPTASDGGGDEEGLLQRYLEDQLVLVLGSVYDCGEDCGVDVENVKSAGAFVQ